MRLGLFSLMKMPPFRKRIRSVRARRTRGAYTKNAASGQSGSKGTGCLTDQHCTAIYIKDLARDESGVRSAQEQDWSRYLFGRANPAERDGGKDLRTKLQVLQGAG